MLGIEIGILIIGIILIIYSVYSLKHTHQLNSRIDEQNKELQNKFNEIEKQVNEKEQNLKLIENDILNKESSLTSYQNQLNDIQNNISKTLDNQKELSQKAFENFCAILEKQYVEKEEEYNSYEKGLETAYSNLQEEMMREADKVKAELTKIKETRTAAIQAITREKEIEANIDDFRLNLNALALKDIRLLKSIQSEISNPIVIDKIIWSNYYQPLARTIFPKIIGKDTTCGIYKITNIITKEVYIGQSLDCCDRWKQHCKNALGVGTSTGESKLYRSMKKEGLNNFTFEILEECDSKYLDEKEKYYIDLYDSYNFGLNGNRGNN